MKSITFILAFCLLAVGTQAQSKYFTRNGHVKFFSSTPMEDIEAVNNGAISVLDTESGAVEVSMLNKSFEFEKALMQEHFNENYMESDKFPKSAFKGSIADFDPSTLKEGVHQVTMVGKLTIHGVTREISVPVTLNVSGKTIKGTTTFKVKPEDYDIKIPNMVRDNIAKEIEITIDLDLEPLER